MANSTFDPNAAFKNIIGVKNEKKIEKIEQQKDTEKPQRVLNEREKFLVIAKEKEER